MVSAGTYVKLFDSADAFVCCEPHEEPRIDAAVSRYLETGGNVDTLLCLDLVDGCSYKTRASNILAWYVTSPEDRRRRVQWEKDAADENAELRQEAGIWDDGE